nr:RNA-directed DNA polymerase, eukaryota [Tanacetum cinerariifolium]
MGNYKQNSLQSKFDQASRISKSVFVSNFPKGFTLKDLWKVCNDYGTMVDVFIPNKKSKARKRFAFVRFTKVINLDRLIENLNTIWIGRFHLLANPVRFERHKKLVFPTYKDMHAALSNSTGFRQPKAQDHVGSYVNVVNGSSTAAIPSPYISSASALVLDDSYCDNPSNSVVDVFIPNKKSKVGKRFAFVRFIKVINLDCIIENLNTIWIGRFYLFANPIRFERPKKLVFLTYKNMPAAPSNSTGFRQPKAQDHAGSYVNVVNGSSTAAVPGPYISFASALVLVDSCVIERDLSKYAMGKVKDVNYITNLRTLLMDEGSSDVKLKYLGGMWVMFEFDKVDTKVNIMQHIVVKLWVHVIQDALRDFVSDERIVWVDIERIPLNVWSRETFMRTGKKWGEMLDIEDNVDSSFGRKPHSSFSEEVSGDDSESDVEEVSETIFGDHSSSPNNNSDEIGFTLEVSAIRKENDQGAEEFSSLVNAKEYVSTLIGRWNGETIILGDFNEVRSIDERRGSCFNPSSARVFDHFISSSGLIDVKLEGYAFTWSHPSGSKMSKLDRFLVLEGLFGFWFDSLSVLSLMVQLGGFDVMVEQTWRSFSHYDINMMIRFKKKLQDLKAIIRCWVKDKRMHRSSEKISIKNELSDIDKEVDRGIVSDTNLLGAWSYNAIEGDENSKFFHGIINKKRSHLVIRGVFDNGLWCTDPGKVKEAFFNHFEARFKKPVANRFMLNFSFNKRLSDIQAADLERNVSRDEIRLAVWNCGENKSPGSDGYTFEFLGNIGTLLVLIFVRLLNFFETGLFSKGCNSSFVALILKVADAKFVNDFRPISLIESVYKVVTKILANRLALVIADLVSDTQFAFVANRQILDGPFILNEILHRCKRKKNKPLDKGLFKGVHLQGSISISHLFYADDAMCIGEWSDANLKGIVNIFQCFFLASRLKINIHKSQVLGVGIPRSIMMQVASSIGCGVMHNQFRYLGVMVKTLSIGGRLTLLKSVLDASSLYNMSIFKVPKGILKSMEAIRSNFFNGIDSTVNKITWAAWDKILASKKNSGLGVSTFHALNRALLLKWVWRFISQDGSLWFRLIQVLYGPSIVSHPAVVGHSFRRPVRADSEHQQRVDLNSLLESVSLSQSHDRWFCDLTSDGEFRVKEVRSYVLFGLAELVSSIRLPSKVKNMLEGVFCVAWWSIWGLRNCSIFNETPPRRSVFLTTLCHILLFGVLVDVIGRFRGNLG